MKKLVFCRMAVFPLADVNAFVSQILGIVNA